MVSGRQGLNSEVGTLPWVGAQTSLKQFVSVSLRKYVENLTDEVIDMKRSEVDRIVRPLVWHFNDENECYIRRIQAERFDTLETRGLVKKIGERYHAGSVRYKFALTEVGVQVRDMIKAIDIPEPPPACKCCCCKCCKD